MQKKMTDRTPGSYDDFVAYLGTVRTEEELFSRLTYWFAGQNRPEDVLSRSELVEARAKELGMDSLAITDHGVMYGVIDFYRAAREAGIKPVLGCEIYVAPGSRFDREIGAGEDKYYHLILLAENNEGYQNLMKIVSTGFVEGFYYKPRVDFETLERYSRGLICLSACLAGEVQRNLARGMYEEGKKAALRVPEHFRGGKLLPGASGSWDCPADHGKSGSAADESGDRDRPCGDK